MSDARESARPPRVVSHVGRSRFGDNDFRGYSMQRELSGHDTFWSIASLAVGGPRLDAAASRCMDDVAVCTQAADPRVWPLKLARLVASFGSSSSGLAAAIACAEGSLIGPWSAAGAAALLVELEGALGGAAALAAMDEEALSARLDGEIEARLGRGERFRGFGVPMREIDERVVLLREIVATRHPSVPGRYWRLGLALEARLRSRRAVGMNVGGAVAALCLDLGLRPEHIGPITVLHAATSFLAHAAEGAKARHAVVQRLPSSAVEYVGAAPRRSPRAGGS